MTIDVTLSFTNPLSAVANRTIYWIPIVGVFVSLVNFDKENGMGAFWAYYQAFTLVVMIWFIAFLQSS
jgi:hypothetical protein